MKGVRTGVGVERLMVMSINELSALMIAEEDKYTRLDAWMI